MPNSLALCRDGGDDGERVRSKRRARERRADGRFDIRRRRAALAADAGDDRGFVKLVWSTPIASPASPGASRSLSPTAPAREIAMRISSPPESGVAGDQQCLGFERHRVDDEPAAGAQRRDRGVEHARLAGAAADEDGVGRRQAASAAGAAPSTTSSPGTPKAAALRRMRAARSARCSIGDGAHGRIGQHPLDRDRAGAGADVPQQFAAPRRERRQRHRAHLALGDLAVMLEQIVGEAGRCGR